MENEVEEDNKNDEDINISNNNIIIDNNRVVIVKLNFRQSAQILTMALGLSIFLMQVFL